jgi:hypothetical protein|tara:strand:+ start:149 stop:358 length:210 start_codon:yes stop_codon:yes gene_type:complete
MPQIGSESNPMMFRKTIVNKESRFRKGMNLSQYKDNYDRIFKKESDSIEYNTEFEAAREKSKTFSMEQD